MCTASSSTWLGLAFPGRFSETSQWIPCTGKTHPIVLKVATCFQCELRLSADGAVVEKRARDVHLAGHSTPGGMRNNQPCACTSQIGLVVVCAGIPWRRRDAKLKLPNISPPLWALETERLRGYTGLHLLQRATCSGTRTRRIGAGRGCYISGLH